ncbi:hypothetical protein COOONC_00234 [Cooperia oncophora]
MHDSMGLCIDTIPELNWLCEVDDAKAYIRIDGHKDSTTWIALTESLMMEFTTPESIKILEDSMKKDRRRLHSGKQASQRRS